MANTKISELPLYTGNTTGAYLVMNNSGQTTTYKVTRESIIGASGTSGTSGSSGSNGSSGSSGAAGASGSSGSSGTSGSNGSSGSSGDSIFAVTGSVWNTTRNVGITGSVTITGIDTYDLTVINAIKVTNDTGTRYININCQSLPNFISIVSGSSNAFLRPGTLSLDVGNDRIILVANSTTGSKTQIQAIDNTDNSQTIIELPCSSSWNNGLTKFKYPVEITGSLTVTGSNLTVFGDGQNSLIANSNLIQATVEQNLISGRYNTISSSLSYTKIVGPLLTITGSLEASGSAHKIVGNTTITGSLTISGNTTITGSLNVSGAAFTDVNINGRMQITTPNGTTTIGGNITPNLNIISGSVNAGLSAGNFNIDNGNDSIILTANALTGSKTQIRTIDNTDVSRTIVELPCSSSWNDGLTKFKYPVEITGSVNISTVMTLAQQSPLPTGTVGS